MKKIIMVLVVVLSAKVAFGQTVEASYGHVIDKVYGRTIYTTNYKIGLPIEYKNFVLEPYAGQRTWSEYSKSSLNGHPFRDIYEMGIKFSWKDTFYIDFNHFCSHDVVSNVTYDEKTNRYNAYEDEKWKYKRWDSQLTTVTVGFKYKYYSVKLD
jgi:hypothetical protein